MTTVDAVVIGAGHNGLVAANLLADAGWDVLVCEAQDTVGGAVRSAEVIAPGFSTDLFSAFYPFSAASPVLQRLSLADHGLAWAHAPAVMAHVFPDDRVAVLARDRHETAAGLDTFAAGDGQAWLDLIEQWDGIADHVLAALFRPFPPVRPALGLLKALGAGPALRLARMAALPVRRFANENFRGEGGPMLFAGNALHADISPDGAGSALYGWLLTMLAQTRGYPVPVGGAGQIAHALQHRLSAAGGQVRTDAPVAKVTVSEGRATGVVLASGELLRARRAVLADVDAPTLYRTLVGASLLPAGLVGDLAKFEWDTPTLKMNWALSSPLPWTAEGARGAGNVQLGVDLDGLTDYAADLATRRMPERPFLLFGQMTTSDPTRSPAGTETAWAYTHVPVGTAGNEKLLMAQVERVEALLERHAPGFGSSIVGRHVQTPSVLHGSDANLHEGAINGGTSQLHQQLFFRPVPGLGGAATPIDRLYLAGSSAHPGGGVHGGPGANAAAAALSRNAFSGPMKWAATRAVLERIYRS